MNHPVLPGDRVALLGLGKMGTPMANAMSATGYVVTAWTRSKRRPDSLAPGIALAPTAPAAIRGARAIVAMLADGSATDATLHEILGDLTPGTLFVDMGTSGPEIAERHAATLASRQCLYVDAPVSGGVGGAERGQLTILAGADAAAFHTAASLLGAMGTPHHLGPTGAGQNAKLANQIVVAIGIAAVAEGMVFAQQQGLEPSRLLAALEGGFADSAVLRLHGPRMAARDFSAGGAIHLHLKDLRLARDRSPDFANLAHATRALDDFATLAEAGGASLDHSAYILRYRSDAQTKDLLSCRSASVLGRDEHE